MENLVYQQHDHGLCISTALDKAKQICQEKGAKLTPLRQQVFELIWQSHISLGAYELLDQLADASGKRIAPPTVYRTLDFLLELGLIHKINALNTYIGCISPNAQHQAYLMICKYCKVVLELDSQSLQQELENSVANSGFALESSTVELVGSCPNCTPETTHA